MIALELHKGRPLNPFVNAGAMATVSLLEADTAQARWDQIQATYNLFAGRELTVNDGVYQSEARPTSTTAALPGYCRVTAICTPTRWKCAPSTPVNCSVAITAVTW